MRKLFRDKKAMVGTIATAVAVAVMIAISMLLVYSILGSLDFRSVDAKLRVALNESAGFKPVANGSKHLVEGLNVFYQLSPLFLIVLIAVGIIGVVMGLVVVPRREK